MNGENPQRTEPPQPEPSGQWQYTPGPTAQPAPYQPVSDPIPMPIAQPQAPSQDMNVSELEWSGSEFIAHSKSSGWYLAFAGAWLVIVSIVYLITREIAPSVLLGILAVILGYSAARKPRTVIYRITSQGVYIGNQFFPYADYKAFSIVDEGAFASIVFWPLKRFGFPIGLYYEPQQEEAIVLTLVNHLPMQEHRVDLVESFMRKIRF